MSKAKMWSAHKSDGLLAAFQTISGELLPCEDDGAQYQDRASQTFAVWQAAQGFPDANLMVLKVGSDTSLGFCNGGVIGGASRGPG